jgi:hypothetical protein
MRRAVVCVLALVLSLAAAGSAVHHAAAVCSGPCADNGDWTAVITGPAYPAVGIPATYTITLTSDGNLYSCGVCAQTIIIPAGVTNVTVANPTANGCPGTTYLAGPQTFSCANVDFRPLASNPVVYTVTFTPTTQALLLLSYTGTSIIDPPPHVIATATLAIAPGFTVQSFANTGSSPVSSQPAPYSGSGADPRCYFGCGPNGLP